MYIFLYLDIYFWKDNKGVYFGVINDNKVYFVLIVVFLYVFFICVVVILG